MKEFFICNSSFKFTKEGQIVNDLTPNSQSAK